MKCGFLSGAGNVFAVVALDSPDELVGTRPGELPAATASWARRVCSDAGSALFEEALGAGLETPRGRSLDGVLVLSRGSGLGAVRMDVINADGSRSAACGNGLRCVAHCARELGWVDSDRMRIETAAGPREVELLRADGRITGARASMGKVQVSDATFELECGGRRLSARVADAGNPHCVLLLDPDQALDDAPLEPLGHALQEDPRFPEGVNVELARASGGGLQLRVFERGVGETAACGTGALATALVAERAGRARLPVEVTLPGGCLRVGRDPAGEGWIEGGSTLHALGEWTLELEHTTGEAR